MFGRCEVTAGPGNHPNTSPVSAPALADGQPRLRSRPRRLAHPRQQPPPVPCGVLKAGTRPCARHPPSWPATPRTGGSSGVAGCTASWVCRASRQQPSRRQPLRMQTQLEEAETEADAEAEAEAAGDAASALPGVVRVQCVQDLPRFDLPLLLGTFRSSVCNAVAVSYCGQPYLLAPAASVSYGSQVRVMVPGRDKPFPARVLHLGLDCELAALALDEPDFWEALVPYELAPYGLPHLQQSVNVVSYAAAQPRPRSAPGTVMRTEVMTYPSAMQRLLGIAVAVALAKEQIGSAVVDSRGLCLGLVFGRTVGKAGGAKAAGGGGMGGGNSGGNSGGDERWGQGRRRVGRRRGRRGQTEASALVVPVPVVTHFLEDIRSHGRYLGFPTLGIQWKRTESAALRRYTGMSHDQTGVAIMSINPTASLAAHAQQMDVVTALGHAAVGNDGTVAFRGGAESINISYHISQFQVGDTLDMTLIRGGEPRTVSLTLGVPHRLLPLHLSGRPPQYMVVSGLVLTVLSGPFLEGAFGRSWAVRAPVQLLREWHNHPVAEDEQVVVVAECQDMGPGTATDGYERRAVMHQRVVRCNGVPVRSMHHLVGMVAEAVTAATATAGGGDVTASGGGSRSRRRGGGAGAYGGNRRSASVVELGGADDAAAVTVLEAEEAPVSRHNSSSNQHGAGQRIDSPELQQRHNEGTHLHLQEPHQQGQDKDEEEEEGREAGSEQRQLQPAVASGGPFAADASASTGAAGPDVGPRPNPKNLVLELSNRMILVLPVRQALEDTREMLAEYEVQHAVSEDLRSVYEGALRLGRGAGSGGGSGRGWGGGSAGRGRGGATGGRTRAATAVVEAGVADGSMER